MLSLWTSTAYLVQNGRRAWFSLITAIPAAFMSAVSVTYILMAEEGLRLGENIAVPVGAAAALALFVFYVLCVRKKKHNG